MVIRLQNTLLFLMLIVSSACVPSNLADGPVISSTNDGPVVQEYHSLDTRTGLDEVDRILAVVESGDTQKLRDLIGFTTVSCSLADGLGGPPICREGEVEGTKVEVLPFLESEGGFVRKNEITDWQGIDVSGLYAVYKISETAYSEEAYPAGEYGIMFIASENMPDVVLQVRDEKIIRVDYVFDVASRPAILQRDASEMVLAPVLKK